MKNLGQAIGQAIRMRRIECGLSQQELAEKAATSRASICRIENGQRNASNEMLQRIAKELDTTPTDLIRKADNQAITAANEKEAKMLNALRQLNDEGQDTAIRQVKELRKIAGFKNQ